MPLAVDFYEHLIQMPAPATGFHARNPPFSDLGHEQRTEPMPPLSHGCMTNIDAALVQKIFHIAERQRATDIQHHSQADYLTARFEIAKWVRFAHIQKLRNHPARLKQICSDSTPYPAQASFF
jgi:hypothetical protein